MRTGFWDRNRGSRVGDGLDGQMTPSRRHFPVLKGGSAAWRRLVERSSGERPGPQVDRPAGRLVQIGPDGGQIGEGWRRRLRRGRRGHGHGKQAGGRTGGHSGLPSAFRTSWRINSRVSSQNADPTSRLPSADRAFHKALFTRLSSARSSGVQIFEIFGICLLQNSLLSVAPPGKGGKSTGS